MTLSLMVVTAGTTAARKKEGFRWDVVVYLMAMVALVSFLLVASDYRENLVAEATIKKDSHLRLRERLETVFGAGTSRDRTVKSPSHEPRRLGNPVMGSGTARPSLVIGTRGSRLAIWQAEWVRSRLKEFATGVEVTIRRIKTSGDKILDVPLAKIGGKGLFVKEIEEALLSKEIDLAVHSMKDVPTALPQGLAILCVPRREDPRDVLVSKNGQTLDQLPKGSQIGTSSLRRQAQLLHYRSDLRISMLRGNLDTRLRKVREGSFDATVLAAAGLQRMGWIDQATEYLSPEVSLPAIGQGAIGIEGRVSDTFVQDLVKKFDDHQTHLTVDAERAFLDRLEGGCQVPIAAHASLKGDTLAFTGLIASVDGTRLLRDTMEGPASQAKNLGVQVAERLLARGGDEILAQIYKAT